MAIICKYNVKSASKYQVRGRYVNLYSFCRIYHYVNRRYIRANIKGSLFLVCSRRVL